MSARNGLWRKANTWTQARIPEQGDTVCIQAKHRIKYDTVPEAAQDLRAVIIHGRLSFSRRRSAQLRVQDLKVMKGCQQQIGRMNSPLPSHVTAEIVFISMQTHSPSSPDFQHQLGLISMGGELELVGQPVERIVKFNSNLAMGTSRIAGTKGSAFACSILAKGWAQGDEVLLPATRFERSRRLGNETRTLSAINGQRIIFDAPLEFSHKRVLGRPITLANLSSNIVIRSAVPDAITKRGRSW